MSASEARNWQQTAAERSEQTYRQTETKKQVKVDVTQRWITPGEKFLYVIFSLATAATLFYVVSFSTNLDALNRDIQSLESTVEQQETINANLTYQVKEYSNPDRILRIAKENGLKIQNTEVKQTATISE
ncbi:MULTISPECIES: cell division protein FtsL [Paraliobacillus]|uniref:cell division protein FtsL n=1 Tax=Paraliobacillus TaxID=200903 RepID=UPI000DD431B0|nr:MULTISPECIES: cell division protein FtsL [Paraliobacillus]